MHAYKIKSDYLTKVLQATKRPGIDNLVNYLDCHDYYDVLDVFPCYKYVGGLSQRCIHIMLYATDAKHKLNHELMGSIALVCILHDVHLCPTQLKRDPNFRKLSPGARSILMVTKEAQFELTDVEQKAILALAHNSPNHTTANIHDNDDLMMNDIYCAIAKYMPIANLWPMRWSLRDMHYILTGELYVPEPTKCGLMPDGVKHERMYVPEGTDDEAKDIINKLKEVGIERIVDLTKKAEEIDQRYHEIRFASESTHFKYLVHGLTEAEIQRAENKLRAAILFPKAPAREVCHVLFVDSQTSHLFACDHVHNTEVYNELVRWSDVSPVSQTWQGFWASFQKQCRKTRCFAPQHIHLME